MSWEEDPDTIKRAVQLRKKTARWLKAMPPQQRDRMMQVHLAQARGPVANITLLRQMTSIMLRIKNSQKETGPGNGR